MKNLTRNLSFFKTQGKFFSIERQIQSSEQQFLQSFVASHNSFSPSDLGEVSRIISKQKPQEEAVWNAFESCVKKHLNQLEVIDFRKVLSAVAANQRGSDHLLALLKERQIELSLSANGVSREDYEKTKTAQNEFRAGSKKWARPYRLFYWLYGFRWRLLRRIERWGIVLK